MHVAPKRLSFAEHNVELSTIARVAAARCGFEDNDVASMLMVQPTMAATRVFDFVQKTQHSQAEQELSLLLDHFSMPFAALGGNPSAVLGEWNQLCKMISRDEVLRTLPYEELYSRLFLHFQFNHINVLLLVALVQAAAMDAVLVECGAARLLSALRREHKANKGKMLLFLMGRAWQAIRSKGDASAICVHSLVNEWCVYSEHVD